MRTVKVEPLSVEGFLPFGFYANLINPDTDKIGAAPIEFFRDMVQLDLGNTFLPSFSTCRVEKRDLVIDVSEYHNTTGEGIMPIDNDMIMHVGPATPPDPDAGIPLDEIRVFHVPKGTFVALRRGVWHHGPFTINEKPVNHLIVLPARTYAVDCNVVHFPDEDRIYIEA